VSLPDIIAIVGPTGVGKTDFSLELARALDERGHGVEIVNADAMQLYRGMDIGTAKIGHQERTAFPHHLIDVLNPDEESSVSDYQRRAREIIDHICSRGNVAILVGGSGLYVSSVLFNFDFPGRNPEVRDKLEREFKERGLEQLHQRLVDIAPDVAQRIDPHNARRVIRALEVLEISGDSEALGTLPNQELWRSTVILGFTEEREKLVKRLDERVVGMWNKGMISEVTSLIPLGIREGITASRAIGYAQALAQIDGVLSQDEAIEQTQALTRRFARRQVSWFKRYEGVTWLNSGDSKNLHQALALLEQ
jgi:tRNA dimethylallyltransferase